MKTTDEIIYGCPSPPNISQALWNAMWAEFQRNGHRMLTDGKVRHLRRMIRRKR